jgi:hypothetical protein
MCDTNAAAPAVNATRIAAPQGPVNANGDVDR